MSEQHFAFTDLTPIIDRMSETLHTHKHKLVQAGVSPHTISNARIHLESLRVREKQIQRQLVTTLKALRDNRRAVNTLLKEINDQLSRGDSSGSSSK